MLRVSYPALPIQRDTTIEQSPKQDVHDFGSTAEAP